MYEYISLTKSLIRAPQHFEGTKRSRFNGWLKGMRVCCFKKYLTIKILFFGVYASTLKGDPGM